MLESGLSSTLRIAMEANITRVKEIRRAEVNVVLARCEKKYARTSLVERKARTSRIIRMIRTIRPHRKMSSVGMLDTRSIQPHLRNWSLSLARDRRAKKSAIK